MHINKTITYSPQKHHTIKEDQAEINVHESVLPEHTASAYLHSCLPNIPENTLTTSSIRHSKHIYICIITITQTDFSCHFCTVVTKVFLSCFLTFPLNSVLLYVSLVHLTAYKTGIKAAILLCNLTKNITQ